jgi:hypothetical protein
MALLPIMLGADMGSAVRPSGTKAQGQIESSEFC